MYVPFLALSLAFALNHTLQALIRDGYTDMICEDMDHMSHNMAVYFPQHGTHFPGCHDD